MTARRYRVYDKYSGILLCEGTIKDCCKKLKCAKSTLYSAHTGRSSRYLVIKVDRPCDDCDQLEQCEKDNKFCAEWWDWFRLDCLQNLYDKRLDMQTLKPKMEA